MGHAFGGVRDGCGYGEHLEVSPDRCQERRRRFPDSVADFSVPVVSAAAHHGTLDRQEDPAGSVRFLCQTAWAAPGLDGRLCRVLHAGHHVLLRRGHRLDLQVRCGLGCRSIEQRVGFAVLEPLLLLCGPADSVPRRRFPGLGGDRVQRRFGRHREGQSGPDADTDRAAGRGRHPRGDAARGGRRAEFSVPSRLALTRGPSGLAGSPQSVRLVDRRRLGPGADLRGLRPRERGQCSERIPHGLRRQQRLAPGRADDFPGCVRSGARARTGTGENRRRNGTCQHRDGFHLDPGAVSADSGGSSFPDGVFPRPCHRRYHVADVDDRARRAHPDGRRLGPQEGGRYTGDDRISARPAVGCGHGLFRESGLGLGARAHCERVVLRPDRDSLRSVQISS